MPEPECQGSIHDPPMTQRKRVNKRVGNCWSYVPLVKVVRFHRLCSEPLACACFSRAITLQVYNATNYDGIFCVCVCFVRVVELIGVLIHASSTELVFFESAPCGSKVEVKHGHTDLLKWTLISCFALYLLLFLLYISVKRKGVTQPCLTCVQ